MDDFNKYIKLLAVDIGASSGRVMLGFFEGKKIGIEEIHRFSNDPVKITKTLYWDALRLYHEILQGIIKSKAAGNMKSIGIDTWGVDFGLLDEEGKLLENPVHYRDNRTTGMLPVAFDQINEEQFYQITGNQFMEINTAFQLLSLVKYRGEHLKKSKRLLLMPDLFDYFLTGIMSSEYSIASTTQLLDAERGVWSEQIMGALSIPKEIFPDIIDSGTVLGDILPEICEEYKVEPMKVIAIAGHDTQCAQVAIPAEDEDFIFLSCGTWSLLGTELNAPLINEKSRKYNITNECAYGGKASFLKNITGLWLVQECRRQWIREGKEYDFGQLEEMATMAKPLQSFIDPDDLIFVSSGDIPERIRTYCRNTKQPIPETEGEMIRCINESLALKYRYVIEQILDCTGKIYKTLHIVGGGTQSGLLCQLTANACKLNVVAGPMEATVLGNIAIQLLAQGYISDLEEARIIIRNSQDLKKYTPMQTEVWDVVYENYKQLIEWRLLC